jgi:hypothetical protein
MAEGKLRVKEASGMIKFLAGNCLSGLVRLRRIRNRFERTRSDLTLWMKGTVKA